MKNKETSNQNKEIEKHLFEVLQKSFNINESEIRSNTRKRDITDPRRIMMVLLKEESNKITIKQIAEITGRKHPNVCIQLRKHIFLMNNNKKYNILYHSIRKEFKKSYLEKTQ